MFLFRCAVLRCSASFGRPCKCCRNSAQDNSLSFRLRKIIHEMTLLPSSFFPGSTASHMFRFRYEESKESKRIAQYAAYDQEPLLPLLFFDRKILFHESTPFAIIGTVHIHYSCNSIPIRFSRVHRSLVVVNCMAECPHLPDANVLKH